MQILDADQTAQALPYAKLVPAIAQAARELASGSIHAPDRMVVTIDAASVLLCMPALGADIGVTKLITVHSENARHGLPAIQGEVIVFATESGRRLALLDGPTVTSRRTAAVTLLGIEKLAGAKPGSVILIGTGVQAAAHANGLIDYFGVSELRIASRDVAKAQALCDQLSKRHPHAKLSPIATANLAQESANAAVVIALTTSKTAVIPEQLPSNTLAIGVGAFKPDMVEFPAALLHARPIVVDHLAGAQHEAGDLIQAGVDWSQVRDLASVLVDGRGADGVVPVLKTVGHAAWDLAAARVAVEMLLRAA
jgi:1-piperideine-2-carboxylate/1-pyrroline-2-carboxylate reductase [NAD(P)H]